MPLLTENNFIMHIENAEIIPSKLRGRPPFYPFSGLNPGQRLIIPVPENELPGIQNHRKRATYAIYNYKKSNTLKWVTLVRVEGNNIVVYRLS